MDSVDSFDAVAACPSASEALASVVASFDSAWAFAMAGIAAKALTVEATRAKRCVKRCLPADGPVFTGDSSGVEGSGWSLVLALAAEPGAVWVAVDPVQRVGGDRKG